MNVANGLSVIMARAALQSPCLAVHFVAHLEEGSCLTEPVEQRGGAGLGPANQEQRRQQLALAGPHTAHSVHNVQSADPCWTTHSALST